jgi:hypothetical protein
MPSIFNFQQGDVSTVSPNTAYYPHVAISLYIFSKACGCIRLRRVLGLCVQSDLFSASDCTNKRQSTCLSGYWPLYIPVYIRLARKSGHAMIKLVSSKCQAESASTSLPSSTSQPPTRQKGTCGLTESVKMDGVVCQNSVTLRDWAQLFSIVCENAATATVIHSCLSCTMVSGRFRGDHEGIE